MRVVAHSNESLYFWMLGVTITLLGVGFEVIPDARGADLIAIGGLVMLVGLLIPLVHSGVNKINELRRAYGGDEA